MIVKGPFGKEIVVNEKYDNKDVIVRTSHVFNDMKPTDLMSRNAFNMNSTSTRVNEARDFTLINPKPHRRPNGLKIGTRLKNW